MPTSEDYKGQVPAWCPGCGNFQILSAVKQALVELGIEPWEVLAVSGIGQSGKLPHYMKCHTFNGLHGRTLPVATAAKLANHSLHVIAVAGDGDCYGEGGNHFLHAIRRNPNITLIVHDNQIYGLTKGQASPTTAKGTRTKVQPSGVPAEPMNPLALAISQDCSFVARGFAGDPEYLKELMKAAITHKGFSLLDILQPCVTFNKVNTFKWYRERVYKLEAEYDPYDRMKAFERVLEWGEKIPNGIFYKKDKDTLEEMFPTIREEPLVRQKFSIEDVKSEIEKFY
ncbi:TPA: 2-oxoacid:ferredoxin oxidoreductase subunit beta [Methanosarcina acetivorans]|uniref:2-oxoacid ferredoxin oxidoreductase, subunit beta n=2 Tax=Methanosarcina acetivorans TaxID=2214 RepID=Q8TLG0_METAC|nr:2-oxoacid:ferredoxin oxidoreductase subunit beta [Methanosarcina acetivorans]AAM06449.1 2-oxoacid ferredoxin oxidoreductase, subunit beta [Methanosarcina acetivorans C2A]HIH95671.1 2-oxoacid:ferredoxin oxidoreductase subunit beta [Methanosarcina acetivorans]